ncbi:MAG: type IV conjugative transfer system protein TraL [Parachlamydia sp.]|nr:MAG: type IV conjugative transfer system protein TraL [Parachlamydia sp.]
MNLENSFVVIKTIDNMPRVIFWRMDEFIVMILPFFIGVCLGSILVTISGPFLKYFYTKTLKKYPTGTLQHRLYWNLPKDAFEKSGKLKNIPGSHLRHFSL